MSESISTPRGSIDYDVDEELTFDEPSNVEILTSVATAIEPSDPPGAPSRGRKSAGKVTSLEPVSTPPTPSAPANADPVPTTKLSNSSAPLPDQDINRTRSKSQSLLLAITSFALLTSTASLGGLIAVGRALRNIDTNNGQLVGERQALADLRLLIAHLDTASARIDGASAHIPPVAPSPVSDRLTSAITLADLHHELDGLKLSFGKHQPEGLPALNIEMRSSFSAMSERLDHISMQLALMADRVASNETRSDHHANRSNNH